MSAVHHPMPQCGSIAVIRVAHVKESTRRCRYGPLSQVTLSRFSFSIWGVRQKCPLQWPAPAADPPVKNNIRLFSPSPIHPFHTESFSMYPFNASSSRFSPPPAPHKYDYSAPGHPVHPVQLPRREVRAPPGTGALFPPESGHRINFHVSSRIEREPFTEWSTRSPRLPDSSSPSQSGRADSAVLSLRP